MSVREGDEGERGEGLGDQLERVNKGSSIIRVQGNESPLRTKLHKEKSRIFSVLLTIFLSLSLSLFFPHLIDIYLSVHKSRRFGRDSRTCANMSRPRRKGEKRKMHDPCEMYYPCEGLRTARIDRPPVVGTAMKMDTRALMG